MQVVDGLVKSCKANCTCTCFVVKPDIARAMHSQYWALVVSNEIHMQQKKQGGNCILHLAFCFLNYRNHFFHLWLMALLNVPRILECLFLKLLKNKQWFIHFYSHFCYLHGHEILNTKWECLRFHPCFLTHKLVLNMLLILCKRHWFYFICVYANATSFILGIFVVGYLNDALAS